MYRLDIICFSKAFQFDREMMLDAAEAPGAIVVIADEADSTAMIGFIIVHVEGVEQERIAYIVTIDVAPEARRGGIGGGLLTHAEDKARGASARAIGLHVAVDNAGAISFYERQGYTQSGVAKRFYREAGIDAAVYMKAL